MKLYYYPEFWYALLLGLGNCFLAVPICFCGYQLFTYSGHDALLGWPFAIVATILLGWSCWCVFWEIVLLQMRRLEPMRSHTAPLVLFCSALVALLLALGVTVIAL